MRTLGIDVSHYQGAIHWPLVAGSDVLFAIAKATDGTAQDDRFETNWRGIQDAGLYRGAYHFARPGTDPEAQAVHFASVVGPLGFRDLPPALDLEVSDGHPAARVLEWARAFLVKAEELFGRRLLVYTGQFWRGPLGNPPPDEFFSRRALWLAGYTAEAKLAVPNTWQRHWTFWQYSNGTVNGPQKIPGVPPCDQSWFNGGVDGLEQLCTGESPAPPPPPGPPPGNVWPGSYFIWPRTPAVSGPAVKAWQTRMIQRGFPIDADGVYGPQSKNACMAFQRNEGVVRDGIVGRDTWNATFAGG